MHRAAGIAAVMVLLASTVALGQPLDPASYALLAAHGLRARGLAVTGGNVGVNDSDGTVRATKRFSAPQSAVVAARVRLRGAATCGALFADAAKGDRASCGPPTPPALPITADLAASCGFPVAPPDCDPSQQVLLRPGAGDLTLPPGTYGDLLIKGNGSKTGTLRLAGGAYVFCSIRVARKGRVEFAAPATVLATGDVRIANGGHLEPAEGSGLSAADVAIAVGGGKVRFARGTVARLLLCAPDAQLELAPGSRLTGRFVARLVKAAGAEVNGVGAGGATTTTTTIPGGATTTTTTGGGLCGNGIREGAEECDRMDLGGATCPGGSVGGALGMETSPGGAFPGCTEDCRLDFGTCPLVTTTSTTSSTTSSTVAQVCGNGVREGTEECDCSDLGGATCPGGSAGGAFPACTASCTLDFGLCPAASTTSTSTSTSSTSTTCSSSTTSSTVPATCGNGVREGAEECDCDDLGGATCPGGSTCGAFPTCTASCTLDFSTCPGGSTSTTIGGGGTTSTTTTPGSTSSTTTLPGGSTSTTLPGATVLRFTTGAPGGSCGVAKSGGANGTVVKTLSCGGLNLGHGAGTVPEGPTPAGADTFFDLACSAGTCTATARSAAETGSIHDCSDTGCDFGPFLPIPNPATPALSTCVHNTFASPGSGMLDTASGEFDGSVPLSSQTTVTGNVASPCPKCLAGTCDASWTAAGGVASPDAGMACTATNASGDTYDCRPPQAPYSGVLAPFPVTLSPIGTGRSTLSGATPCPGQTTNGCFGQPGCDYVEENGMPAGPLGGAPQAATLASAFCIPATGNVLVDGSAGLPGPGATSLPGTLALE